MNVMIEGWNKELILQQPLKNRGSLFRSTCPDYTLLKKAQDSQTGSLVIIIIILVSNCTRCSAQQVSTRVEEEEEEIICTREGDFGVGVDQLSLSRQEDERHLLRLHTGDVISQGTL